jgi:hypothetical protein
MFPGSFVFRVVTPLYRVHAQLIPCTGSTHGGPGPVGRAPWTHGGADRGHGSVLTGTWPPAAPVRQSSPAGAQNGEGSEGNSTRVSPEFGRRCGGRAMVVHNEEAAALGEE